MRARFVCLAAALLSPGPLFAQDAGTYRALIVGVNEYIHLDPLRCCVDDAKLIHGVLKDQWRVPDNQVILMTDDSRAVLRPSRAAVVAQVGYLVERAQPGDTVVVYFSGHGLGEGGPISLALHDTSADRHAETGLPLSWLKDQLERCRATKKLVLLDCCYAGSSRAASKSLDVPSCFADARGLITLASCQASERSYEWPEMKHGFFTYFLAKGLAGDADGDDGRVDTAELSRFVQKRVPEEVHKVLGLRQMPKPCQSIDTVGEFIVTTPGRKDATPGAPYPIHARRGQKWKRGLYYLHRYKVLDGQTVWPLEYRETRNQVVEVKEVDAAGRPVSVEALVELHRQEMHGRVRTANYDKAVSGPWHGKSMTLDLRPGGPDARAAAGPQPHPLAIDEALLPVTRLSVGETTGDGGRLLAAMRLLLPDAGIEATETPTVTLARKDEGERVLVFEGRGRFLACLGTPARTTFDGTWAVEYLPGEERIRLATLRASGAALGTPTQGLSVEIQCVITQNAAR